MGSFWGEEDKEGDLNGCTRGADVRRSNEVVVDVDAVGYGLRDAVERNDCTLLREDEEDEEEGNIGIGGWDTV